MSAARTSRSPTEDVFPFRAQWIPASAARSVYRAALHGRRQDQASARGREGRRARLNSRRTSRLRVLRSRQNDGRSRHRGPQPVRGVHAPGHFTRRLADRLRRTRRPVAYAGDEWRVHTAATHPRCVPRHGSRRGRRTAPGSPFPTDRQGSMDLWVRELGTGAERKIARACDVGGVVARRRSHRLSRSRITTARRGRGEWTSPQGARSAERAGTSELVSRWSCDRDVGAPPVLDQVPRGHEPGAARRRSTVRRTSAGSTPCRTSRSACVRTRARCGRPTAPRWRRSSTDAWPRSPSRATVRRLVRRGACRTIWPTRRRGRAIRGGCCISRRTALAADRRDRRKRARDRAASCHGQRHEHGRHDRACRATLRRAIDGRTRKRRHRDRGQPHRARRAASRSARTRVSSSMRPTEPCCRASSKATRT